MVLNIKFVDDNRDEQNNIEIDDEIFNEKFTNKELRKTIVLSSIVASLALSLCSFFCLVLQNFFLPFLMDFYGSGINNYEYNYKLDAFPDSEKLSLYWTDLLLAIHLHTGSIQFFLSERPEPFLFLEYTTSVEYSLGFLVFLAIPFLVIMLVLRICKKWLPANMNLIYVFIGVSSFLYASILTGIALLSKKVLVQEVGPSIHNTIFFYNILEVFSITLLIAIVLMYTGLCLINRKKGRRNKNPFLLAIKVLGTVYLVLFFIMCIVLVFGYEETLYDATVYEILKSEYGFVLAFLFAFYFLCIIFGGSFIMRDQYSGFIDYSIYERTMLIESNEIAEFQVLILLLSENGYLKITSYLLILLPILLLIKTGFNLAKSAKVNYFIPSLAHSISIAGLLFFLACISKVETFYSGYGFSYSTFLMEINPVPLLLYSFLLSLICTSLGSLLHIIKTGKSQ